MRTFLAAVSMLSALPLGRFCPTETELQRSQNLFPAAGLLFGVLLGCAAWGLVYLQLPLLPTAMLLALLPPFPVVKLAEKVCERKEYADY